MLGLGRLLRPLRLRGRLLLANLVVAGAALGTVLIGVSLVGPGYFEDAMGHRPGDPAGQMMDALTLAAFQEAIRTALLAGGLAALGAAVVVSIAISTRVARPVSRLVSAARRIAEGHYAERVPVADESEVGELAIAFNQMTDSLEATERRRLQLVGDVAHELRTPLSTLDGYLEGLQDGVIQPGAETWELLRGETGRLTRLVTDLQELWRADARELPLQTEPVEVGPLLVEVTDRFTPIAAAHQMRVESQPSIVGLKVQADADRLRQILANYVSNAIRLGPQGSAVTIAARVDADRVVITVSDEGPGLTREQCHLVFERFYRIDPSRSRAQGGSGIGLAIARALAQAMGGQVWAESDGAGLGARFSVALPASR